jgi:hypothetical protein
MFLKGWEGLGRVRRGREGERVKGRRDEGG